ncbi:FAD-dependent monooxygenase [Crossiella sp. CA-258035]|uniref:FAD-dependent oxidoreductase n=1 Tax=Crossiella sp. CA-258035 TaxID=2981138 RepID=UPI0024BC24B9|nr:FAD-dependent monooxygenase [Crossiella sp. CA-258035]WHT22959.1 FAD-dependent monooxygenase [Crossiella sp. CA-258035]
MIGAGLGGLCLAQGLRRAGISVAVYERDVSPVVRAQGHRLHLDAQGHRALAASLPPELFALIGAIAGRPAPRVTGFDEQLRQTAVFELAADLLPAPVVLDRHVLRQVLLRGLDNVVEFGRRCVGYQADGEVVTAHFADGSARQGTLLVGADGIGSVIRAQRLPQARVVDSGVRLIYGRVPLTPALRAALPPAMISVFNSVSGPGQRFLGIAPVEYRERPRAAAARLELAPDSLAVMFGRRRESLGLSEEDLRTAPGTRLREVVLDQITGWHPVLRRIVTEWDTSTLYPIRVRSSVPLSPWASSNVTLLGDAIHAMSPAAGAGANMALRDAAALSAALANAAPGTSLVDVVRDYERHMVEEGFDAVKRSSANGVRLLGENPLPTP